MKLDLRQRIWHVAERVGPEISAAILTAIVALLAIVFAIVVVTSWP